METSKAIRLGIYTPNDRDGGMSAGNVVTENRQYAVLCQIDGGNLARLPFRRIHIVFRGRQTCQFRSFGLLTVGIICVDARYQGQNVGFAKAFGKNRQNIWCFGLPCCGNGMTNTHNPRLAKSC